MRVIISTDSGEVLEIIYGAQMQMADQDIVDKSKVGQKEISDFAKVVASYVEAEAASMQARGRAS